MLFPVLLYFRARGIARTVPRKDALGPVRDWPVVSVVIAAHDELTTLPGKLASLASLAYPAERCQWVIVSDGSSDGSAQVAGGCGAREHPSLNVCHYDEPAGKPTALNRGVDLARAVTCWCSWTPGRGSDRRRCRPWPPR